MILEKIKKPNDIHKIPLEDFEPLAAEIRDFLIRSVSRTGGHLASNLGVVELTLALHNVLDFPEDKLIWDVGHQAYTHKILTGRKDVRAPVMHMMQDTVPIQFRQDWDMCMPEIFWDRSIMWFL